MELLEHVGRFMWNGDVALLSEGVEAAPGAFFEGSCLSIAASRSLSLSSPDRLPGLQVSFGQEAQGGSASPRESLAGYLSCQRRKEQ